MKLDLHQLANQPGLARPTLLKAGALNGEDETQSVVWEVMASGSIPVGCMMQVHAATQAEAIEIVKARLETEQHRYTIDHISRAEFDDYQAVRKT